MVKSPKPDKPPARLKKAKLDTDGLTRLGMDKLVSLVLEETASNRPLKVRVMAALASLSGPEDAAKLVDKRLASLENVHTRVKGIKARQLVDSIASLLVSIQADIAEIDVKMGMDRLVRLLRTEDLVNSRFPTINPKLEKTYEDTGNAIVTLAEKLTAADQVALLDAIDELALREPFGYWMKVVRALVPVLKPEALKIWQAALEVRVGAAGGRITGIALQVVDLLQAIARAKSDTDALVKLERMKPVGKQEPLELAQMLFAQQRFVEALEWVRLRRPTPASHETDTARGAAHIVDLDRVKLEAAILEGMKDRKAAQAVRWEAFAATLDAGVLKDYIAKAEDFTEFDELDKAFALAMAGTQLYPALKLLVEWPKPELAARFIIENRMKWDGRNFAVLTHAADMLGQDHPLATTILLRSLITTILERSISPAYEQAASYYYQLCDLASHLPDDSPLPTHGTYMLDLERKHGRKFGFWGLLAGR
jgi:hypothetical protein